MVSFDISEVGEWEEDTLSGYGPATRYVWVNEQIDGVIKVALSEGMHIMKCERGEWLLTVNIGGGGEDKFWCFDSEEEAVENAKELMP